MPFVLAIQITNYLNLNKENTSFLIPPHRIAAPLRRKRREHPLQVTGALRVQGAGARDRAGLPPVGAHEAAVRRGAPPQVPTGAAGSQQSPARRLLYAHAKVAHIVESL